MPSAPHEAIVATVHERPTLPVELLRLRGFALPKFDRAELMPADLSTLEPTEFRSDAVVRYTYDGATAFAIVYEVQLGRDSRKRRTWPAYVANAYEQAGCPVILVVVAPKPAVARRCAVPIVVGEPDFVLTPMVFGPDGLPVVTDPGQARRNPQLAVLSALAHGDGPDSKLVLDSLVTALDSAKVEHVDLYAGAVLATLSDAARTYLEAIMTKGNRVFYVDAFQKAYEQGAADGEAAGEARGAAIGEARGAAIGEARGEAKAVLEILSTRGLEVSDGVRERITGCTDVDQLTVWIRRAVVVRTVDDLFELPDAA